MKNADIPAVPFVTGTTAGEYNGETFTSTEYYEGITKREYFAARAPEMPEWFELDCTAEFHVYNLFGQLTLWRYTYADAMCAYGDEK